VDCLNNIRTLEDHGIRFIAVTQGLDADQRNPASQFLLHVLGAAAEFERSLIRERTQAGRLRYQHDYRAGKVGKTVYSRSGKNPPVGRPKRIFNRERVIEMRRNRASIWQIAKQLGGRSRGLLSDLNPLHVGGARAWPLPGVAFLSASPSFQSYSGLCAAHGVWRLGHANLLQVKFRSHSRRPQPPVWSVTVQPLCDSISSRMRGRPGPRPALGITFLNDQFLVLSLQSPGASL
jgi:hypothetical protein